MEWPCTFRPQEVLILQATLAPETPKWKWGFFQIPPDLVVKSQIVDIVEVI